MLVIIYVQRNASHGEIMFNVERKMFIVKERIVLLVTVLFCVFIAVIRIINFFVIVKMVEMDKEHKNQMTGGSELSCVVLMSIVFITLISYLWMFYRKEFKMNITNMSFFYFFEVSITAILLY